MNPRHLFPIAALVLGSANVSAVSVTLIGSGFDITYDSATVGLFGAPVISGNQIAWFPSGSPGFTAQTASGVAIANSTFAFKVTAQPGWLLSSFSLTEAGDYFYFGDRTGVAVSGQLRVTPLPGVTIISPVAATGPFTANVPFDFSTTSWSGAAAPITLSSGATLANVSVQNILAAFGPSSGGGYAYIEKKEAFLTIGVSPVPEPATYGMMLIGLGIVTFLAMRTRRN